MPHIGLMECSGAAHATAIVALLVVVLFAV
jgi:hypothetical protein